MPEHHDPTPDVEELRRALREARHDAPIPPEVAARLDEAVAQEQRAAPAPAGRAAAPVALLERRRRQRAVALLVAAATIVAVGVGVGRLLRPGLDAASSAADIERQVDAGTSREKVERGTTAADGLAAEPAPHRSREAAAGGGVGAAPDRAPTFLPAVPEVSDEEFVRDVRRVRRLVRETPPTQGPTRGQGSRQSFPCETSDWGSGTAVAVRYDQAPSVLVLRPSVGETQVADLLPCGSGEVLRSVTLAAP